MFTDILDFTFAHFQAERLAARGQALGDVLAPSTSVDCTNLKDELNKLWETLKQVCNTSHSQNTIDCFPDGLEFKGKTGFCKSTFHYINIKCSQFFPS